MNIVELSPQVGHAPVEDICRLCGGTASALFDQTVLDRYSVRYYRCEHCGSAQTEPPYWLDEAYRSHLASIDTGAAQRNIHNLAACYSIARLFGLKTGVDIGGSDGLLCRLLRDYGLDYYVQDKYARPAYAQGFTNPPLAPDMVSSFEVLEHFSNPRTDLDMLFQFGSRVILTSTAIYQDQPKDWWYYAPQSGQHVFFYSRKALEGIAERYNHELITSGGFILFVRQELLTPGRRVLARVLLQSRICKLLRARMVLLPSPGVWNDYLALTKAVEAVRPSQEDGDGPRVQSPPLSQDVGREGTNAPPFSVMN